MLYDKKEAARILNVSIKSVDRAVTGGKLKCRRIGAAIRFTGDDLERYVGAPLFADREKPATPEGGQIIPSGIIKTVEKELDGMSHGTVSLVIHVRDGHPRFVVGRERSFMPDTPEKAAESRHGAEPQEGREENN